MSLKDFQVCSSCFVKRIEVQFRLCLKFSCRNQLVWNILRTTGVDVPSKFTEGLWARNAFCPVQASSTIVCGFQPTLRKGSAEFRVHSVACSSFEWPHWRSMPCVLVEHGAPCPPHNRLFFVHGLKKHFALWELLRLSLFSMPSWAVLHVDKWIRECFTCEWLTCEKLDGESITFVWFTCQWFTCEWLAYM